MSDEAKFVQVSSKEAIHERRLTLLKEIDGDIFYPLSLSPNEIKMAFWKKPIGDEDAFKLVLFLFGNGCPPAHIKDWIVSSTFWEQNKATKRWEQVNWMLQNGFSLTDRVKLSTQKYLNILYSLISNLVCLPQQHI